MLLLRSFTYTTVDIELKRKKDRKKEWGGKYVAVIPGKHLAVISNKYMAVISNTYLAVISCKYLAVISVINYIEINCIARG